MSPYSFESDEMSTPSLGSSTESPWPMINRIVAAIVTGLILLVLSALVHTAAAASLGTGWSYLWMTWLIVVLIALLALSAPTSRSVWARLCFVNGLASAAVAACVLALPLPEAALREIGKGASLPRVVRPLGAAFGAALASGAVGIAAIVAALLFFACAYLFRRPTSHRRAILSDR
jgi:hypothetical protein